MNFEKYKLWLFAGLAGFFLALSGCSTDRDPDSLYAPDAVGTLVIDAVLIVDQPLPSMRLSRTLAPNVPYTLEAAAEEGAMLVVTLGPEGLTTEVVYEATATPGTYRPAGGAPPVVLPGERYAVAVTTEAGEVLTAETTTPQNFAINQWVLLANDGSTELRELKTFAELGDGVYSHPDNQLVYPEGLLDGRYGSDSAAAYEAAGFQLAIFSLDPDAGFVIDPPFLEEEDFAEFERQGSSPALNGEDGFVRLPWFTIFYDGRYLYKAFVVDSNWFDLIRTIPEGGGGLGFGGNVGEGVDPPLFHVNGGIGLFGSASVDSIGFFITPVP